MQCFHYNLFVEKSGLFVFYSILHSWFYILWLYEAELSLFPYMYVLETESHIYKLLQA